MIINNEQNISMCFGVGIPEKCSTWSGNCVLILPSCYACHCICCNSLLCFLFLLCFFFSVHQHIFFTSLLPFESQDLQVAHGNDTGWKTGFCWSRRRRNIPISQDKKVTTVCRKTLHTCTRSCCTYYTQTFNHYVFICPYMQYIASYMYIFLYNKHINLCTTKKYL